MSVTIPKTQLQLLLRNMVGLVFTLKLSASVDFHKIFWPFVTFLPSLILASLPGPPSPGSGSTTGLPPLTGPSPGSAATSGPSYSPVHPACPSPAAVPGSPPGLVRLLLVQIKLLFLLLELLLVLILLLIFQVFLLVLVLVLLIVLLLVQLIFLVLWLLLVLVLLLVLLLLLFLILLLFPIVLLLVLALGQDFEQPESHQVGCEHQSNVCLLH